MPNAWASSACAMPAQLGSAASSGRYIACFEHRLPSLDSASGARWALSRHCCRHWNEWRQHCFAGHLAALATVLAFATLVARIGASTARLAARRPIAPFRRRAKTSPRLPATRKPPLPHERWPPERWSRPPSCPESVERRARCAKPSTEPAKAPRKNPRGIFDMGRGSARKQATRPRPNAGCSRRSDHQRQAPRRTRKAGVLATFKGMRVEAFRS